MGYSYDDWVNILCCDSCVSSGSVPIDCFFSSYFLASRYFFIECGTLWIFPCCMLGIFVFLKIFFSLFWSRVKLIGNNLIILDILLRSFRCEWNNILFSTEARLICIFYPIPHENRHYFWLYVTAAKCHLLSFWVVLSLVFSSSSHACTYQLNIYSKEYSFWSFLSVVLTFSSLDSVLRTLVALFSSISQLYLLDWGLSLGFPSLY